MKQQNMQNQPETTENEQQNLLVSAPETGQTSTYDIEEGQQIVLEDIHLDEVEIDIQGEDVILHLPNEATVILKNLVEAAANGTTSIVTTTGFTFQASYLANNDSLSLQPAAGPDMPSNYISLSNLVSSGEDIFTPDVAPNTLNEGIAAFTASEGNTRQQETRIEQPDSLVGEEERQNERLIREIEEAREQLAANREELAENIDTSQDTPEEGTGGGENNENPAPQPEPTPEPAPEPTPEPAPQLNEIFGTSRNNTLTGTSAADDIRGLGGKDTLYGEGGNDILDGGDKNDELHGGSGNDRLIGGKGRDDLYGDDGDDVFVNNGSDDARDNYYGGAGRDQVISGGGDIQFRDFAADRSIEEINALGNDILGTSGGDDLDFSNVDLLNTAAIRVGNGNDTVQGSRADDTIYGENGKDTIHGNNGNDRIYGGSKNDELHGGHGDDFLDGGTGKDDLYGDNGDDTLVWDHRKDEVDGGAGKDTLLIQKDGIVDIDEENISNIEVIDLTNGNQNTVTININDVFDMSGNSLLELLGENGDVVNSTDFTARGADQVVDNTTFATYTSGGATLYVELGLEFNGVVLSEV